MIDIHSHILPALDDGATDMDQAVEICRVAWEDGTDTIVGTPHFYREIFATPEVQHCERLRAQLESRCRQEIDPRFRVLLGSDCHLHPEIVANVGAGRVPTINGSRYLLVELSDGPPPPGLQELFFSLRLAGIRPILTHPERHRDMSQNMELLTRLVEQGALAQVTAASLVGLLGDEIERAAREMVERHLVQIIASDAHHPVDRAPGLTAARDVAAELIGEGLADAMVNEVPAAIVENRTVDFPAIRERARRSAYARTKDALRRRLDDFLTGR